MTGRSPSGEKREKGGFRSFTEAREFARSLGLENQRQWHEWSKIPGNRPPDIPATPEKVYRGEWAGFGDWLGTFRPATKDLAFRPFDEARTFARSLGLRSRREYEEWWKNNRPADVPQTPNRTYSDRWVSWRDWLGTEDLTLADYDREFPLMFFRLARARSQITHERFKADPSTWWKFHAMFLKSRARWTEEPIRHVAELIRKKVAPPARIADLGCGLSLLSVALKDQNSDPYLEYDVTGVDHIAYEPDVACDMAHTPFEDSSFDVAVFCLSLLGCNWPDYLSEARRILRPGGTLFIVESPERWERMDIKGILEAKRFTHIRIQRGQKGRRRFVYAQAKLAELGNLERKENAA